MQETNAPDDFSPTEFTKPVLVAGAVPFWVGLLAWAARAFFVFALYYWSTLKFAPVDEMYMFIIATVIWLGFEIPLTVFFFKRRWILKSDDGFIFSSLFGSESFSLADIDGTSLSIKESPGQISIFGKAIPTTTRKFNIWIRDREKPIRLKHGSRSDRPDPLSDFILQLLRYLTERFLAELESGGSVKGANWMFSDASLGFVDASGQPVVLPMNEVGAVEIFGDKLHVWRRGEQDACFSTPADGKNVDWLLLQLRSKVVADTMPVEGLGRFLFEEKRPAGWMFATVATLFAGAMVVLPFVFPKSDDSQLVMIIVEIVLGLLLVCVPLVWAFLPGKRFHENGFVVTWPRSEKEIPFEQVETFEWSRTDNYYNGGYAGSIFAFQLYLHPETGTRKFNLGFSNHKGEEGNYGIVRQKLIEHLAHRMKAEWTEKKRVPWVTDIFLTDTGVVYEQRKRGEVVAATEIPFTEVDAFGMLENASAPTFGIAHKDGKQGLQFGTGLKNFYPGLQLFGELLEQHTVKPET